MKKAYLLAVISSLAAFILPLIPVSTKEPLADITSHNTADSNSTAATTASDDNDSPAVYLLSADKEASGVISFDNTTRITLLDGGKTVEISLRDYILGAVAAEMPASYPEEALKAQATAIRSIVLYKLAHSSPDHPGAAVCSDSTHCQAYIPWDTYIARGGDAARIESAVDATDGMIAVYKGEPILAVFHAVSSGATECAADIWGGNVDYLVSVESSADKGAPNYEQTLTVSADDFIELFKSRYPEAILTGAPRGWFSNMNFSNSGAVLSLEVGGIPIDGDELRSLVGLASSCFTAAFDGTSITFTTHGYGHGVGMSQYGARCLALEGKSYIDIIEYYYSGVTVSTADSIVE